MPAPDADARFAVDDEADDDVVDGLLDVVPAIVTGMLDVVVPRLTFMRGLTQGGDRQIVGSLRPDLSPTNPTRLPLTLHPMHRLAMRAGVVT
ncbi:hypothetical protein [Dyella solisilvae]|uniref:hypothetical protein n=1 Tax=Dyella solisilvae TaxID=1920168 RepID=UPI0018F60A8D|nr:hypothetical protein [Dyella solisilvae]